MIKHDCVHLKRVTNNDIIENNRGTLRCDVHRAAPDPSQAGISCPADCMGYRPRTYQNGDNTSAFSVLKNAFMALLGKS